MTTNTTPQHYRDTCTRCIELEQKISELNALAKKKANKAKQPQFYSLIVRWEENKIWLFVKLFAISLQLLAIIPALFFQNYWFLAFHVFVIFLNLPFKIAKVPVEPLSFDDPTNTTTS